MIALLIIVSYLIVGFVGAVLYVRSDNSETFDTEHFVLGTVFWPIYGIVLATTVSIQAITKFVEFLTNKKAATEN